MTARLAPLFAAIALILPSAAVAASQNVADLKGGNYTLDRRHTFVTAKVMHFGASLYVVRFNTMEGTFTYDPAHPEATRVQASVDTGSLDVGADYQSKFAEEFLAASKFPKMTFVSTAVAKGEGNAGTMTGDLTMRGVTKPVTFDVVFTGVGKSPLPPFTTVAGFSASAKIKRSDFGSDFLNNGIVGDEVTITIDAGFEKK